MDEIKDKTVGQLSLEASLRKQEPMRVRDQTTMMHEEYGEKLFETVAKGRELYREEKFFFIEDITRQERLMMNVLRHTLIPRITCPTPNYDQTVYRYSMNDDTVELIWTIPSPETCSYYLHNRPLVVDEERELMEFILAFRDGILERLAQQLNDEKEQFGIAFVKDDSISDVN
jgi:hypothetical protein